jgi:hypothetical protein
MPNVTLLLVMILALMLWRSVLAAMHQRDVLGETGLHHGNASRRRFRISERAGARVSPQEGVHMGSHEIRPSDRNLRAKTYLLRIVALTGGRQTDAGYLLDVGETRFYVRDRYVRRMRDATNPECGYDETCFYCLNRAMPRAEEIASALLQLKNNPSLFDKWARENGLAFKADGEVFTRAE